MTNADKYFRCATDEELAKCFKSSMCPAYFDNETSWCPDCGCKQCWLDWLKKEVQK